MAKSFTVPARVAKCDIPVLGELKGSVNDRTVEVGGRQYRRGTLRFDGFAGSHVGGQVYEGVHRLCCDDAGLDGPHADLNILTESPSSEDEDDELHDHT